MSVLGSIVVSLFSLALVFFVLSILFLMVKILSRVLAVVSDRKPISQKATSDKSFVKISENQGLDKSTGELKLINVDERTAAMIMAIVSHESQTPLCELSFKSIRAIEKS